jgi:hypothetical protein
MPQATSTAIAQSLGEAITQKEITLSALSEERPLLLVFLRHFG